MPRVEFLRQVFSFSAADGVEKVPHVRLLDLPLARLGLLHQFSRAIVGLPVGVRHQQPAVLTVDRRPLGQAVQPGPRPEPHFVLQDLPRVVVADQHGVGPFLVIFEEELPPRARDVGGEGVEPHQVPAIVDAMDAIVPQVACAVIEQPPPVPPHHARAEGTFGGGALPEVIVETGGGVAGPGELHLAIAVGLPRLAEDDPPQRPAADVFRRLAENGGRPHLRPHLDHAVGLAGGGDRPLPLDQVVAGGLFDVDILVGQAAVNGEQGMPVIGRGDHQHVDGGVVEECAIVVDQLRLVPGFLGQLRPPLLADWLIDVADVGDLDIGFGGEGLHDRIAPPADANAGDADFVIGSRAPSGAWHRPHPPARACQRRGVQKIASIGKWHRFLARWRQETGPTTVSRTGDHTPRQPRAKDRNPRSIAPAHRLSATCPELPRSAPSSPTISRLATHRAPRATPGPPAVLNPIAAGQRSRELVPSGRRLDRHSSSPAAPAGVAVDVAETGRAATAWYGSRQNPLRARSPCAQAADLVSPRRGNWSQRRRPAGAGESDNRFDLAAISDNKQFRRSRSHSGSAVRGQRGRARSGAGATRMTAGASFRTQPGQTLRSHSVGRRPVN